MRHIRFLCIPLAVIVLFCSFSMSVFAAGTEIYIPILPEFVSMSGDTATLIREFSRSSSSAKSFFSDFAERPFLILVTQDTWNDYSPATAPGIGSTITQKYVGEDKQWSLVFIKAKSNNGSFFFQVSDLDIIPAAARSMPIRFFAPSAAGNQFEALTYHYDLKSKSFSLPAYSRTYSQTFFSYLVGISPFTSNGSDNNGEYYTLKNEDNTSSIGFQIGNPEGSRQLYPYQWWIGKNPVKEEFLPPYIPDDSSSSGIDTSSGSSSTSGSDTSSGSSSSSGSDTSSGSSSGEEEKPEPEKPLHPSDLQVTVTIRYIDTSDYTTICPDTVFEVDYGSDFYYIRPDIPGYSSNDIKDIWEPDLISDRTFNFYYYPDETSSGDIPTQTHIVTINMKYWDGTRVTNPVKITIGHGMPLSYDFPILNNYYYLFDGQSLPISSVTNDMEINIIYYPNGYDPNPPPVIKKYTITILYRYSNGTMAAIDRIISVPSGGSFYQASPIIKGYTPNTHFVSGSNVSGNATYIVTYYSDAGSGGSSGESGGSGTPGEPDYSGGLVWKFWDFHDYPYKPLEFEDWNYMAWYEPKKTKPLLVSPSSYPDIPSIDIPTTSIPAFDITSPSTPEFYIPTTSNPKYDIPETSIPEFHIPTISIPEFDVPIN